MGESVAFDRAAEFYDSSRAIAPEAMARTIELLAAELEGRGRVLEIGVGTGLLALPLHARDIPLAGLDLSGPMLAKLVQKAGGEPPFPLVLADGTRMPIANDAFGAAYLRWVLHLIPDWRALVAEGVRVVRPGGVLVANLGAHGGPYRDIQLRFGELTGMSMEPVGLDWSAHAELDAEMTSHGASVRVLPPPFETFEERRLDEFITGIEENRYSWTWSVPDDLRLRTVGELRRWARERFGPLDVVRSSNIVATWRAYDLP